MNKQLQKNLDEHEVDVPESEYDNAINQLINLNKLKWIPWIGTEYEKNRILFIGDSSYADGAPVDEKEWTRVFILIEGFLKEKSKFGNSRLLRSIEKTMLNEKARNIIERKSLWQNVAYLNVSQRAVEVINKVYGRPTFKDFIDGWNTVLEVLLILKPVVIIKWGVAGIGELCNNINQNEEWFFAEAPVNYRNAEAGINERSLYSQPLKSTFF